MNRNGEFSSNKKEERLKVLDSLNKAQTVKKPSEEFNISLNTLNTKNSGTLANIHSSGKSKLIPDKLKKNEDNKIIELYKMNPNSDLDFQMNDNINTINYKPNEGTVYHNFFLFFSFFDFRKQQYETISFGYLPKPK